MYMMYIYIYLHRISTKLGSFFSLKMPFNDVFSGDAGLFGPGSSGSSCTKKGWCLENCLSIE